MQVSVSARLQGKVRPERGPAATTDFEKWPREGRIYMMLQCRATMPGQQKFQNVNWLRLVASPIQRVACRLETNE
jgi:hypothetical protein